MSKAIRKSVWVIAPVKISLDPRHQWWLDSFFEKGFSTFYFDNRSLGPLVFDEKAEKFYNVKVEATRFGNFQGFSFWVDSKYAKMVLSKSLKKETKLTNLLNEILVKSRSRPSNQSINQVAKIYTFLIHNQSIKIPDLIVANDLVTAIAVNLFLEETNQDTYKIYDAQEIFTDMWDFSEFGKLTNSENHLWKEVESQICSQFNRVVTVSPGISKIYLERHNVKTSQIPNFPLKKLHNFQKQKINNPVRAVYMGHAAPNRGLEKLIEFWGTLSGVDVELDLYIPSSNYRNYLQEIYSNLEGEAKSKINFFYGVNEDKMLETLSQYDIGIIPYNYSYPYSHCSPNKLGQYLSQGLAILTNEQEFIAEIVRSNALGMVFNWNLTNSFKESVNKLLDSDYLLECKKNAIFSFEHNLNWNTFFDEMYQSIDIVHKNEVHLDEKADVSQVNELWLQSNSMVKRTTFFSRTLQVRLWPYLLRFIVEKPQKFSKLTNSPIIKYLIKKFSRHIL